MASTIDNRSQYSLERKVAVLKKMLPPNNCPIAHLAEKEWAVARSKCKGLMMARSLVAAWLCVVQAR
jgi:hypothetical protein